MVRRVALVLLCALACAGCEASASIASVRDPSTAARLQRLYIAVDRGSIDPLYAQSLGAALYRELRARGVRVQMRVLSGLDLDERLVARDVAAWRPDGVLIVNFAGGSGIGVEVENANYDVSLIEAKTERRIWRAQVTSVRRLGTTEAMMEEAAARVAERLESDRLLAVAR